MKNYFIPTKGLGLSLSTKLPVPKGNWVLVKLQGVFSTWLGSVLSIVITKIWMMWTDYFWVNLFGSKCSHKVQRLSRGNLKGPFRILVVSSLWPSFHLEWEFFPGGGSGDLCFSGCECHPCILHASSQGQPPPPAVPWLGRGHCLWLESTILMFQPKKQNSI